MHCNITTIKGVNGDHGTDRKQSTPITDLFAFLIEFNFKFRIIQISTHFFHDDNDNDDDDNGSNSNGAFFHGIIYHSNTYQKERKKIKEK